MARNGAGTYSLPAGNPVVTGTVISSTVQNNTMTDVATALTQSLAYDGQTLPIANLPMGTYRHTNVGNGVDRIDYSALGQVQDGVLNWVAAGGSADALTATYSPVITALVDGQICFVRATATNATTTPTFSPNSLTARTITKLGGVAVVAGEWVNFQELILRYNLANTRWELLNPKKVSASNIAGGTLSGVTIDNSNTAALKDTLFTLQDDGDATKILNFQLSGITTGTTRTITIPDKSGTMAMTSDTLRSYLSGLTMSTAGSSSTMTIAAGQAADSTNSRIINLISSIGKTTSSWAVGTGNGGLDTGSIANSTWYHFYLIMRVDTSVVDVVFSTSASAPTLPTNYTLYRRIGSGFTNGSAQWTKFIQNGDLFRWDVAVNDVSAANPGSSAVLRQLSVPTGIKVEAWVFVLLNASGEVLLSDPAISDQVVSATVGSLSASAGNGAAEFYCFTDTSRQIRTRMDSGAAITLRITTFGWKDSRGRND